MGRTRRQNSPRRGKPAQQAPATPLPGVGCKQGEDCADFRGGMRPVFQFGAFAGTVGEYDHRALSVKHRPTETSSGVASFLFGLIWFLNTTRPGQARHVVEARNIASVNAYGARPGGAMTDRRWSSRRAGCRSSDRLLGGSSPDLSIGDRSSASGDVSRRLADRDDPAGLEPQQVMAPRGRALGEPQYC